MANGKTQIEIFAAGRFPGRFDVLGSQRQRLSFCACDGNCAVGLAQQKWVKESFACKHCCVVRGFSLADLVADDGGESNSGKWPGGTVRHSRKIGIAARRGLATVFRRIFGAVVKRSGLVARRFQWPAAHCRDRRVGCGCFWAVTEMDGPRISDRKTYLASPPWISRG